MSRVFQRMCGLDEAPTMAFRFRSVHLLCALLSVSLFSDVYVSLHVGFAWPLIEHAWRSYAVLLHLLQKNKHLCIIR